MSPRRRQALILCLSVATILGSLLSILLPTRTTNALADSLHAAVGEHLALATLDVTREASTIVLVTLEHGSNPTVDRHYQTFKETFLKSRPAHLLKEEFINPEGSPKYGPGIGLSARKYQRLARRFPHASAIVSLIGLPDPEDLEPQPPGQPAPAIVAYTRSPKRLASLFHQKRLLAAVAPRFLFPSPGPEIPSTRNEWFTNRFQTVFPDQVAESQPAN